MTAPRAFAARTIEEAMAAVERALGPDARIVATETSSRGVRILATPAAIVAIPRPDDPWTTPARSFGLSREMLGRLALTLPRAPGSTRAVVAAAMFAHWLRCDANWPGRRMIVVGPNGAGKTTTVVKLAARAMRQGADARITTLDPERAGALAQLNDLAAPHGIAIASASDVLADSVVPPTAPWIQLLDSPGIAPSDRGTAAAIVSSPACAKARVVLALPADMRRADAARHIDLWQPLGLARVIVTKWDVASAPGELLELAIERSLTLSFITNGRDVRHDLVAADAVALATLGMGIQEADLDAVADRWRALEISSTDPTHRRSNPRSVASGS